MLFREIRSDGAWKFVLDFHPRITVLAGLGVTRRAQMAELLEAALYGRRVELEALLDVHGRPLGLPEWAAEVRGSLDSVDLIISGKDLPGAEGPLPEGFDDAPLRQLVAEAESGLVGSAAEVESATTVLAAAVQRRQRVEDESARESAHTDDDRVAARPSLADARARLDAATFAASKAGQVLDRLRQAQAAAHGVAAVRAQQTANEEARAARLEAQGAVWSALTQLSSAQEEVALANQHDGQAAERKAAATAEVDELRRSLTQVTPVAGEASVDLAAASADVAAARLAAAAAAKDVARATAALDKARVTATGDQAAAARAQARARAQETAEYESRRAETSTSESEVAALGASGESEGRPDPGLVAGIVQAVADADQARVGAPLDAGIAGLLERIWQLVERRQRPSGVAAPQWLVSSARTALEEARLEMMRVNEIGQPLRISPSDAADLERAHRLATEAEDKADRALSGPLAKRKLVAARAIEQGVLDRLALPSYGAYLLRVVSEPDGTADERVERARRALADAEVVWEELRVTDLPEERADFEVAEARLRADVAEVLGTVGPDESLTSLAGRLQSPLPVSETPRERLVHLLADVGVVVGDDDPIDVAREWVGVATADRGPKDTAGRNKRQDNGGAIAATLNGERSLVNGEFDQMAGERAPVDLDLDQLVKKRADRRHLVAVGRTEDPRSGQTPGQAEAHGAGLGEVAGDGEGESGPAAAAREAGPVAAEPSADARIEGALAEVAVWRARAEAATAEAASAADRSADAEAGHHRAEQAQREARASETAIRTALNVAEDALAEAQAAVDQTSRRLAVARTAAARWADELTRLQSLIQANGAELEGSSPDAVSAGPSMDGVAEAGDGLQADVAAAEAEAAAAEAAVTSARAQVAAAQAGVVEADSRQREATERAAAAKDTLDDARNEENGALQRLGDAQAAAAQSGQRLAEAEERLMAARAAARAQFKGGEEGSTSDAEIYFLARLAAVRSVGSLGSLPVVMVDPLVYVDAKDSGRLLDLLVRMSEVIQIVYLSDRPEIMAWAESLGPELTAIRRFGRPVRDPAA